MLDSLNLHSWMKNILGSLLIILLALLCLNQYQAWKGTPQTMSVTAAGKSSATPDQAVVTLGVVSEAATAIDAKNTNNQKMNQVISFIKQQGIDDKDIQTSRFYSAPKYNYANGQNTIVGFQANQTITVKLRHIDQSKIQLEKIVDGAVMNGANQVQGIDFSFADNDKLSQEARKQAIDKAKLKAEQIAADAGLKLGRMINVMTSESNGPYPMPMAMADMAVRSKSVAPSIEPGSQEVSESATVVFQVY